MKNKIVVELDELMPFGMYINKTLREVIDIDPRYYDWLLSNLDKKYTLSIDSYIYFRERNPKRKII